MSENMNKRDGNPYEKYLKVTPSGDDESLNVVNAKFTVGERNNPKEAVFGEGNSYPVPIAYHCKISDTTGLTIINAVDIAEILQSDDGSLTGLFGGISSGDFILVGSDSSYGGVKAKIDTAGVVERDFVLGEYLEDNLPTWTEAPYMVTDSDFPKTQRGDELAAVSGSQQWRFGFNPLILPTPWDLVEMNINGQAITAYWARFRIVTDITTDPIIQQIKLHTNRVELDNTGIEYFGRTRYDKPLIVHQRILDELNGFAPKDQTIDFADGISVKMKKNKLEDSKLDGYGGILTIPSGLDTSIPVTLTINYEVENATAGDIETVFETAQIEIGDDMDGTHPIDSTLSKISTVGINEETKLKQFKILVDVRQLKPQEFLVFKLTRNASVTRINDTYIGDVHIVSISAVGYFWKP